LRSRRCDDTIPLRSDNVAARWRWKVGLAKSIIMFRPCWYRSSCLRSFFLAPAGLLPAIQARGHTTAIPKAPFSLVHVESTCTRSMHVSRSKSRTYTR
jgi:hypothetical protein